MTLMKLQWNNFLKRINCAKSIVCVGWKAKHRQWNSFKSKTSNYMMQHICLPFMAFVLFWRASQFVVYIGYCRHLLWFTATKKYYSVKVRHQKKKIDMSHLTICFSICQNQHLGSETGKFSKVKVPNCDETAKACVLKRHTNATIELDFTLGKWQSRWIQSDYEIDFNWPVHEVIIFLMNFNRCLIV